MIPVPVRTRVICGLCEREFAKDSVLQHGHLHTVTRSRVLRFVTCSLFHNSSTINSCRVRQALRMTRMQYSTQVIVDSKHDSAKVPCSHAALYEQLPLCLFCCQFFEEGDGPHGAFVGIILLKMQTIDMLMQFVRRRRFF